MRKFFLIINIGILLTGCDPYDGRLTIVNNTNDTIFYKLSKEGNLEESPIVLDKQNRVLWNESLIVFPDSSTQDFILGRNGWESYINEECEDSTLRIFIFKKNLILNVAWDSIVDNQLYSKKINVTIEDLEKQNWKVIHDELE